MKVQAKLQQWIADMSRNGHEIPMMLEMMEEAGYGPRQSRRILAKVLNRPAIALDVEVSPASKPGPPAGKGDGLRTRPPEAPAVDIDGRRITVSTSLQSPVLRVLHNVLDQVECDALIEQARPRLERALTVDSSGTQTIDDARTSSGMFFHIAETPLVQSIEHRIAKLLQLPVEHGEALQILHYQPGQQYEPHQDWFDPTQPSYAPVTRVGGQRIASLIIYLNTPEAGGGTHFPHAGLTVAAHRGSAVYFAYETGDKQALHAGLPVERGEKWIATRWLRERPYHEDT